MASYGHTMPAAAPRPGHPPAFMAPNAPMPLAPPAAPVGTFAAGTKIQVGSHRVVIQKYLSEGGFAHVYLVKLPKAVGGTDLAVLKRVAVPDKEALRGMRIEVETMKRLRGHGHIVTYIDSHASELRGGGYEVFLLMEYCDGGGLIDFMNTRLQHRLTEPEILAIFADVAEGAACMHYLKPPLLHRDLKVENVLITMVGSARKFKLCDFGSAAPPRPAPNTVVECRLMDEDVQKHTTMQYRSPEMIDVYRKLPLDEKSDIWALGVLLYKLCYYTTPFEEQGQLAILNASYKFPSYPAFSDRLKKLIASMLKEHPQNRPNIYQVLREACIMQGREVPIKDIYSGRSQSEPRGSDRPPTTDTVKSTPAVGAVFSPSAPQNQVIPEIVPMRRGRLPASSNPSSRPVKSNASPMRVTNGDPFAALDAKQASKAGDVDELSSKFPTLDQFSILLDQGATFTFDSPTSPPGTQPQRDLSQRVAERLADEAFAPTASKPAPAAANQRQSAEINRTKAFIPPEAQAVSPPPKSMSAPPKPSEMSRASAIISSTPELKAISSQTSQPVYDPKQSKPVMVSTGTMTSTPPPERPISGHFQIYRFPPADHSRSSSLPRPSETGNPTIVRSETPLSSRQGNNPPRVQSLNSQTVPAHQPSSSRPSLEGARPSMEFLEPITKSKSQTSSRPRPASTHLESNLDYLREREALSANKPLPSPGHPSPRYQPEKAPSPLLEPEDETNIESNVEFLRSLEDSDPKKKDKSQHKHGGKRSSLTSLSGTKNILAGKFGDAFKRFEGGNATGSGSGSAAPPPPRTPSPLKDLERRDLTPITGSEATDGRSDDGQVLEETDDMTPEMRREVERRRLSMEEKRVAAAGAEYRRRVAQREHQQQQVQQGVGGGGGVSTGPSPLPKSIGGVSRAVSIQNKVQSLLDESSRSSAHVSRTAQGYGPYADAAATVSRSPALDGRPAIPRKPISAVRPLGGAPGPTAPKPVPVSSSIEVGVRRATTTPGSSSSADPAPTPRPVPAGAVGNRPTAPPKPVHLNKNLPAIPGGSSTFPLSASPPKPTVVPVGGNTVSLNPTKTRAVAAVAAAREKQQQQQRPQIVAADLPGQPALDMSVQERDDYIRDFQKRFPSLTSIEMVERDLAAEERPGEGR